MTATIRHAAVTLMHLPRHAHTTCRVKSASLQWQALQPFARSASTAKQLVKQRQALAEQEMAPCTFHPCLDPHSLALVAQMVSLTPAAYGEAFALQPSFRQVNLGFAAFAWLAHMMKLLATASGAVINGTAICSPCHTSLLTKLRQPMCSNCSWPM